MHLSKLLAVLNSDKIRLPILKILYRKNGLNLTYFKSYCGNRFFIYCVDGIFVAFESLNWFINLNEFERHCNATGSHFYKPKKGDVVIDVGAGLGEEAIVYSNAVGPSGRVVAIEANPDVCQVLTDVVKLNKLSNVEVVNVALSPVLGAVTMNNEVESYLSGSLQNTKSTAKYFKVDGMPLSELIERYGIKEIDLLKVNIEGAERFLTEEIRPEVFKKIKNIAISCHDFRYRKEGVEFFRTKEIITAYFNELGFRIQSQSTGIEYIDDWIYGVRK